VSATLWRRKLVQPLIGLLRQGLTPEKVALTIALGITLGVTPVLGSTALLCTLAALALRLNLPAIQLVNLVVYPLQLALLVPFLRAGAWLFHRPLAEIALARIFELIRTDIFRAVATLWVATLHALVAWFALGSATTALLYLLLVPVLKGLRADCNAAAREARLAPILTGALPARLTAPQGSAPAGPRSPILPGHRLPAVVPSRSLSPGCPSSLFPRPPVTVKGRQYGCPSRRSTELGRG